MVSHLLNSSYATLLFGCRNGLCNHLTSRKLDVRVLTCCYIQAAPRPASPLTSGPESGPDTPSSKPSSNAVASGSSIARPLSPPGGPRAAIRRRAAADHKETVKNARPSSTRAAGAGGSSGTMLRLYTDESQGFRVDPVVVLVLSLGFIMSVVALHSKLSLPPRSWVHG